jgi:hypothetical protein
MKRSTIATARAEVFVTAGYQVLSFVRILSGTPSTTRLKNGICFRIAVLSCRRTYSFGCVKRTSLHSQQSIRFPKRSSVLLIMPDDVQSRSQVISNLDSSVFLPWLTNRTNNYDSLLALPYWCAFSRNVVSRINSTGEYEDVQSETPQVCQFTKIKAKSVSAQLQCLNCACIICS